MSRFSITDTIVAVATPPGRGGLGVVRISGPDAIGVASSLLTRRRPLEPRRATFTRILAASRGSLESEGSAGASERSIDSVIATWFPAPASYTGEHVVEVSAHGSPVLLDEIVAHAVRAGARLARPGEFTLRAFLNGRVDLVQAEAVADLINAATPEQARLAFDQLNGTLTAKLEDLDRRLLDLVARLEASIDFPDEGYHFLDAGEAAEMIASMRSIVHRLLAGAGRGRLIREGAQVAIIGRTNVGKSSVFNNLVGSDRAIVSEHSGTTRDLLTERVDMCGIPVTIVDTAGRRVAEDVIEREGVSRALTAAATADACILVLDGSTPLEEQDLELIGEAGRAQVIAINKRDLPAAWDVSVLPPGDVPAVFVSALTGAGLDELRAAVGRVFLGSDDFRDTIAVTNLRHIGLLRDLSESFARAEEAARARAPEEFVLADLELARVSLEEISGRRTAEDVLRHIFDRFCIGK